MVIIIVIIIIITTTFIMCKKEGNEGKKERASRDGLYTRSLSSFTSLTFLACAAYMQMFTVVCLFAKKSQGP